MIAAWSWQSGPFRLDSVLLSPLSFLKCLHVQLLLLLVVVLLRPLSRWSDGLSAAQNFQVSEETSQHLNRQRLGQIRSIWHFDQSCFQAKEGRKRELMADKMLPAFKSLGCLSRTIPFHSTSNYWSPSTCVTSSLQQPVNVYFKHRSKDAAWDPSLF